MYIITGGAGFIGSQIAKALNNRGISDIILVDDLTNGHKVHNISHLKIADYIDKDDFRQAILNNKFRQPCHAIFHQGACSATTEWNGKYILDNNYQYSIDLFNWANQRQIPFLYASSAAVYGNGENGFKVAPDSEHPLNVYGYSKLLFDQWLRRQEANEQINTQYVGLRYFNVYGPNEQHKGSMASVAWHLFNQHQRGETLKLFGDYDGYTAGSQLRDFIYVDDAVDVNLWFLDNSNISGIFNCGTGKAQPFNDIANTIIKHYPDAKIEYIDFPDHLKGVYQSYTQADMSTLQQVGYQLSMKDVEQGVTAYLQHLQQSVN